MSSFPLSRRGFLGGLGAGVAVVAFPSTAGAAAARSTADGRSVRDPGPVDEHGTEVVHRWIPALYDVVVVEGLTPPNAARTYSYCTIAMYEAAVAGMPHHRSLGRQLTGLGKLPAAEQRRRIDWPTAISKSVHDVARDLFVDASATTVEALRKTHDDLVASRRAAGVAAARIDAGTAHGARVAGALVRWIRSDGYAGTIGRAYQPPVGASKWEPTPPNYGTAIEPYWHEVRPMVLTSATEIAPAPPVKFSAKPGSRFRREAEAVVSTARQLTEEHKAIARFWTDNPRTSGLPSGHWHLICLQLCALRALPLSDTLEVHARTGIALHDAFLNCWAWKYQHNLLRPVTYIRRYMDADFTTYVNTPQFPEYTSGHSVASGAAATVLTELFGRVAFTDDSHAPRGHAARHYRSIWEAAGEAARSRLYGGIHYPMAITAGIDQGREIGRAVIDRLDTHDG